MLIGSVANLIQISSSLSDQIIDQGFEIHWTGDSIIWCKIRSYIAQCASLTALSCLVLSVIDRFLSTCQQIKWRRLNSIYTARQISSFVIIFWIFVSIPTLIYAKPIEISFDQRLCTYTSVIWSKIIIYFFNLCCYGIFPWVLMSFFGCLTFRNLHQIRTRRIGIFPSVTLSRMARIDHQLNTMIFLQITICFLTSIPFCIEIFYKNITATIEKNNYRQAQEYLIEQISYLIFYFNYISSFYINYSSSIIFRQVSKQVLINLFKKKEDRSRQITIINHQQTQNQFERPHLHIFTIQPAS
jgi:hypothetical protein